jgi:hypothetical protein
MLYRALLFVTIASAGVAFVFQSVTAVVAAFALAALTFTARGMDQ